MRTRILLYLARIEKGESCEVIKEEIAKASRLDHERIHDHSSWPNGQHPRHPNLSHLP